MRLKKFIIENFRGLKGNKNHIDFTNSNIIFLIGQNNVGKSTYLRAYEFFLNSKQKAQRTDFYNLDTSIPIKMEGWFEVEENDQDNSDFMGSGVNHDPEWVSKWAEGGIVKVRKTWSRDGALFIKETYSPSESSWAPNGFGGFDSLFTKYAPTPIAINAIEDEVTLQTKVNKLIEDRYHKKLRDNYATLCAEATDALKTLQNKIMSSEEIIKMNDEMNRHFSETFKDKRLKIEASSEANIKLEDAIKKTYTVSVQHEGIDRDESFLQNGHGISEESKVDF
ncbi:MAG: ATP-binding protein [Prevotella sp.]|jgi:predicted ATP-dependent endonuclease of OLD family|nr:ATP-binding protein [Prevotella sp.]